MHYDFFVLTASRISLENEIKPSTQSSAVSSQWTLVHLGEAKPELRRDREVGIAIGLQANDRRSIRSLRALQRRFEVFHAIDVKRLAAQPLGDPVPSHCPHLGAERPSEEHPFIRLLHRP